MLGIATALSRATRAGGLKNSPLAKPALNSNRPATLLSSSLRRCPSQLNGSDRATNVLQWRRQFAARSRKPSTPPTSSSSPTGIRARRAAAESKKKPRAILKGRWPVLFGGLMLFSISAYSFMLFRWYSHAVRIEHDKHHYPGFDSKQKRREREAERRAEQERDTIPIYEKISDQYDSIVGRQETAMYMPLLRRWLTWGLKGDVLEVSVGTGRNHKYIPVRKCQTLTMVDASGHMLDVAKKNFKERYPFFRRVIFLQEDASKMTVEPPIRKPFGEDAASITTNAAVAAGGNGEETADRTQDITTTGKSEERRKFDYVIQTMGICSHKDPVRLLRNLEAHCKEDGKIYLLEHGLGYYDWLNIILNAYAPGQLERFGCHWNRDIGKIVEESGLKVDKMKRFHFGSTWYIEASPRKASEITNESNEAVIDLVKKEGHNAKRKWW